MTTATLTVPEPMLAYESLAPGVAALELPLTVSMGPVTQDGAALDLADVSTFGLVTYRRLTAGSSRQVWAPQTGQWQPETGPDPATSQPLAFIAGDPRPWQGLVVAAGAIDAADVPVFGPGVGGFPAYSFAGVFVAHDGELGVSGSSPAVSFRPVTERNLMVLGPGEGQQPEEATQTRVQLRSAGFVTLGGLVIDRASPGAEVTLSNSAGASVVLRPDGSIEMRPAVGRSVLVAGDLETEQITFRPFGGGTKKTLT